MDFVRAAAVTPMWLACTAGWAIAASLQLVISKIADDVL